MIGFLVFAALVAGGVFFASKKGLFKGMAGARWGLAPGEAMVDIFSVARALQPLTRGQSAAMTAANVVGIFLGFQVGRSIELMTMVTTSHRTILALTHGDATAARLEFSPTQPCWIRVFPGDPGYRLDGIHAGATVVVAAPHLDHEIALIVPHKFLSNPPPYVTVVHAAA